MVPGDPEELRAARGERELRLIRTGPNSWRYVVVEPDEADESEDPFTD
jgi:hypothetical protein